MNMQLIFGLMSKDFVKCPKQRTEQAYFWFCRLHGSTADPDVNQNKKKLKALLFGSHIKLKKLCCK